MQLWFYKATYGDWWDKVISWWTWSLYSHVELVFKDGLCFTSSSRDGGVRFKNIPLTEKWFVIEIGSDKEEEIREWCETELGKAYDWLGAIGCGIGMPCLQSDDKWFCSEVVGAALNEFSIKPPTPIRRALAPGTLYQRMSNHQ